MRNVLLCISLVSSPAFSSVCDDPRLAKISPECSSFRLPGNRSSSTLGISIHSVSAGTTFHNWLGHSSNRQFVEAGRSTASPLYYTASRTLYLYKNGDRYIGSVREGFPNGEGTMNYADGKIYNGGWANGVRSGHGEQQWNAGAVMVSFSGTWANDRPNGKGVMLFTSGQKYEGNFVNGKMHGKGRMVYTDGKIREGAFADNKREGIFVVTGTDGSTTTQTFLKDILVAEAS